MQQRTINKAVTVTGVGLHSGQDVILSFHPANIDHGIVFERSDLPNASLIPAQAHLVKDTVMSSNLIVNNVKIGTVEHLLSAVSAFGIDNLLIKVSDAEIPIMDGSAQKFVEMLIDAGITEQNAKKHFIKIIKPVKVSDGDKWCELKPFDGFELNFEIQFDHPVIAQTPQEASFILTTDNFIDNIAQARTFGFLQDIEYLRQNNLALGGSLDNAIVVDDNAIMNPDGLRMNDEFVRHKILDAIGDLFLIGYPILGQYNAYKSGHALNNELIKKVLADTNNYKIITSDKKTELFM